MRMALKEARAAAGRGEVPVGAVVVSGDKVLARFGNMKETLNDPTAHAEVLAIREACLKAGSWRLPEATLYVTLEPCVMCMGAMILARIKWLVYGCDDPKTGACGSLYDLSCDKRLNHRVEVTRGALEEDCRFIIQSFFKELRNNSR